MGQGGWGLLQKSRGRDRGYRAMFRRVWVLFTGENNLAILATGES